MEQICNTIPHKNVLRGLIATATHKLADLHFCQLHGQRMPQRAMPASSCTASVIRQEAGG